MSYGTDARYPHPTKNDANATAGRSTEPRVKIRFAGSVYRLNLDMNDIMKYTVRVCPPRNDQTLGFGCFTDSKGKMYMMPCC